MKTILSIGLMAALCLAPLDAPARDWDDDTLTGALIGAATGIIVAHHTDVSPVLAIPAGALLGGALANADWSSPAYNRGYCDDNYRYERYRHDYDYRRNRHDYYDRDYYRHPRAILSPEPARKMKKQRPQEPAANLHPGVEIIKVPITLPNGTRVDIPVFRLGEKRFVGPQGEEYTSLPTSEALTKAYTPKE